MKHITRILDDLDTPEALRNTVVGDAIDIYERAKAALDSASARFDEGSRRISVPQPAAAREYQEWQRWYDVAEYNLDFARRIVALALQAARTGDREDVADYDNLSEIRTVSVCHRGRVVTMVPAEGPDGDHGDFLVVFSDDRAILDLDDDAGGGLTPG